VSDETASHPGELALGSQVAGYRLEEQIGRGGMAVVYRARHIRLDRRVALKVLQADAADDEFRERFVRESRAAAAVDHPHIIPIYDAGESGSILYIAMRYVEGGDVWALVKRHGRLPLDRVCTIVAQVASALDAAHAHGLVHRDVKPANILLDRTAGDGQTDHVYLSDFGVTKSSLALPGLTSTGMFVGTLDYVAPEQIEGRRVDGRADAYALACTTFEMLSGAPPFNRDQPMAVLWAQVSQPAPALTSRCPDLDRSIDAVFAKALAKNPDDRYPDCHGFAAALRAVSQAQAGPADRGEATQAVPAEATQAVLPPKVRPAERPASDQPRQEAAAARRARPDPPRLITDDLATAPVTDPRLGMPPVWQREVPSGWPDQPEEGAPTRKRTTAGRPPRRRRRRRGLVLFSAVILVAAAGAAAGIIANQHLGPATHHSSALGQQLGSGTYQGGYAGPGCPAAPGASATATSGSGGDGWTAVGGGLPVCGSDAVASRKTGSVGTAQDAYLWSFRLSGPASCSIKVYVPSINPSSGTAHYGVYGTDIAPTAQVASFDIPQAQDKGKWVEVGPWPIGDGMLQLQLTDQAAYAADTFHVTASAAQAICH
jgi:serine/threonine-protein kinase